MNFIKNISSISISFVMLILFSGFVHRSNTDNSTLPVTEFSAKLNDDFSIILDESKPISENYVADISQFKNLMTNQLEAEEFINNFSRPFLHISVDLAQNKAFILLEFNEETSSWTVNEWNSNLKGK